MKASHISQVVNYEAPTSKVVYAALPKPVGYKLLLAIPNVGAKTEKGVFLPDDLRKREETASIVANVVAMGAEAYNDPAKFPNGPWCKVGDWVMFRSYAGTRFKVNGQEYRMVNDDSIDGTVESPATIERV